MNHNIIPSQINLELYYEEDDFELETYVLYYLQHQFVLEECVGIRYGDNWHIKVLTNDWDWGVKGTKEHCLAELEKALSELIFETFGAEVTFTCTTVR